jgi:methionyl-tRNA formyltransferase
MRIVFCGTPSFAVPSLKHLLEQSDFEVTGVITQPDRPRGRGLKLSPSPVKEIAKSAGVPVHQPEKIRAPESEEWLRRISPHCIVIIAYGQIIPARLLSIPKLGWINLHASLLPKYRGAAPIQWAIANGETRTGLTTMRIDAGMDTGDILLQESVDIAPDETTPLLAERLAEAGAPLMVQTLRGFGAETLLVKPQDHAQATSAPLLKKEIYNRMRGFTPWPGSFTTFRGSVCHIFAEPASNRTKSAASAGPGTLRVVEDFPSGTGSSGKSAALLVSCGDATELRVLSIKREGGKSVDALEFARAEALAHEERFGDT